MRLRWAVITVWTLASAMACAESASVWLEELDLSPIRQGWGTPQPRRSVEKKPMTLAGKIFKHGVGAHAAGAIYIALDGKARRFEAVIGVDDEVIPNGTVTVRIYGDKGLLFDSGLMTGGGASRSVSLKLNGLTRLSIIMGNGGDNVNYDHVDFADARIFYAGEAPKITAAPKEEAVILTPPPPDAPRINGPRIFGVRPGSPFLFRIPCTGLRPMTFAVENLPEGLSLDVATGIVTGTIASMEKTTHTVTLKAENSAGSDARDFRIVVGDTLALTPPMGWNHWYAHYDRITDAMMREAADVMVDSGMADAGYMYVNIDDCWMAARKHKDPKREGPFRDGNGVLIPNAYFPDMRALAEYIHAKGLRAGLYISPGPLTCAGFAGSYKHEEIDAKTFAAWGYDFLKYDWCSYGKIAKDKSLGELQKPYIQMSALLRAQKRDIVLNLCQYGMGDVWTWGEKAGGHCWRTAGDLGFELTQFMGVARRNAAHHPYAHPGAWNDPDYLQIGDVGAAHGMGEPKPCPLTPNEQYAYMSVWCLMAAPLVYSGDMATLDAFTLNVLCNPEVIDIDQDPLGKQGYPVDSGEDWELWTKPLEDGSLAIGLFNLGEFEQPVTLDFAAAGLDGPRKLRDLWRQQDLGVFEQTFTASVPRHGVFLVRATAP